ncbi:MAG TPA: hypothetical protein VKX17_23825 [Planctomycetota bacterium]|nr:hypothetical protein [Planctomycetota bacterium]
MESLTPEAKELLVAAVAGGGDMLYLGSAGYTMILANKKDFVNPESGRTTEEWEHAVLELKTRGFIKEMGPNGEVFKVTQLGFIAAHAINTGTFDQSAPSA